LSRVNGVRPGRHAQVIRSFRQARIASRTWRQNGADRQGVQGERRPCLLAARSQAPPYLAIAPPGETWAEIGRLIGQRKLSVTADTYTHVLMDGREVDYAELVC
jgi:hypothetical protein